MFPCQEYLEESKDVVWINGNKTPLQIRQRASTCGSSGLSCTSTMITRQEGGNSSSVSSVTDGKNMWKDGSSAMLMQVSSTQKA